MRCERSLRIFHAIADLSDDEARCVVARKHKEGITHDPFGVFLFWLQWHALSHLRHEAYSIPVLMSKESGDATLLLSALDSDERRAKQLAYEKALCDFKERFKKILPLVHTRDPSQQ